MAIKITDNFQVNIKNPIDNRFVVGSQSIPGGPGSIYPTPFYAYRDDISSSIGFVYPGLRIWDFNENLPYVWTGTTWSNENLTGASVEGSGNPGGTGFQNYVTKFKNNATVLTKSLLFDDYIHVSLGTVIGGVNPNGPAGSAASLPEGLHVQGRIRTNKGFVGVGEYLTKLDAGKIDGGVSGTGRLGLQYISTNGLITASTNPYNPYLLTTNGSNLTTSWQSLLSIVPHWQPTNLPGGVPLYSGENSNGNFYEFFSLTSQGLNIIPGTNMITLESKPAVNMGGGSASVYKGLNTNKIHEFKTINSDFMNITEVGDVINLNSNITSSSLQVTSTGAHGIKIEIPASFEGTDYYVNNNYPLESAPGIPNVELGTRSKPFRSLKRCINKILNRPSLYDAGGTKGYADASPETYDPNINRPNIPQGGAFIHGWIQDPNTPGVPFQKWEIRTGPGKAKATYENNYSTDLPGGGAVRIIIQSYTEIDENLAINGVTYFLENGGYGSMIVSPGTYHGAIGNPGDPGYVAPYRTYTYNAPGSPEHGSPFEYMFDMKLLTDNAERGHPQHDYYYAWWDAGIVNGYVPTTRQGVLDYSISCRLEGSGIIQFNGGHTSRKGFFRAIGTNNYDWTIEQNLNGAGLPIITESEFGMDQFDSYLYIGSDAGYITLNMDPLPDSVVGVAPFTHIQPKIPLTKNDNTTVINREGVNQNGYKTTAVPDYGAIQIEGRNLMFSESLNLAGTLVVGCNEQHMIYAKDYGSLYSESGRIYMRRHYQQVLISEVCYIAREVTKGLDYLALGSYGTEDGYYKITYGGSTTAAQWNFLAGTTPGALQNSTSATDIAGYWRYTNGDILPTAPPSSWSPNDRRWIGLVFRVSPTNRNGGSAPWFISGGSTIPYPTRGDTGPGTYGSGQVQSVLKVYMPSNHVYDIYLKNGGSFNQGGDFYTQQNTGASTGGPCAFVCVENNVPATGDDRHPTRGGLSSTFCGFSANGGGFVTNLMYNNYIKYIMDDSYLVSEYNLNTIQMKSMKFQSAVNKHLISVVKTSGAIYANNYQTSPTAIYSHLWNTKAIPSGPTTPYSAIPYVWPVVTIPPLISGSQSVWTSGSWISDADYTTNVTLGDFNNCYFRDLPVYSYGYRTSFSNISINNRRYTVPNLNNGLLRIGGTSIELSSGFFNYNLPVFETDTEARNFNYPIGAIYRQESTGILRQRQLD